MASRKRTPPIEVLPPDLPSQVEQQIRLSHALPLRKLTSVRLARNAEAELQERLIRAGLERTGKHVRVPLKQQLLSLLRDLPSAPLAGLAKRLAGTSQSEVKQLAYKLARNGDLCVALVDGSEHVALPSPDMLSALEVHSLLEAHRKLSGLLKKVSPKKGQPPKTLARKDLGALLRPALEAVGESAPAPSPAAEPPVHPDAQQLVMAALARAEHDDPLVFVPDVVRSLAHELTPEQVLDILTHASHDGTVELRPESGIRTLSAEDAALCMPGPQGTVLSYVRRTTRKDLGA